MKFSLAQSLEVLGNTPSVLSAILHNLSEHLITANEGEDTWTAKEVVAHLIVCEETNWIVRANIILSGNQDKIIPMDMKAHFDIAQATSIEDLLSEFQTRRTSSIQTLRAWNIQEADLKKSATHPKLGEVTLRQLLSTWVTHDLAHIAQISRVLAKQNKENVGPFIEFLRILQ